MSFQPLTEAQLDLTGSSYRGGAHKLRNPLLELGDGATVAVLLKVNYLHCGSLETQVLFTQGARITGVFNLTQV